MNEIRILSGMHRGVSLPLDEEEVYIGSSLESDIALVDPNIADQHLRIYRSNKLPPNCWHLDVLDENTRDKKGRKIKGTTNIQLGHHINISGIWITTSDEKAPWPNQFPEKKKEKPTKSLSARSPSIWVKIYCLAAGILVGIVTLTHAGGEKDSRENIEVSDALLALSQNDKPGNSSSVEHLRPSNTTTLNDESLMLKFRKMLKERDLNSVEVTQSEGQWIIQGKLSPQENEKLLRMEKRFKNRYSTNIDFTHNIEIMSQSLPFSIKKVVSGPMGHIESETGHKIYIGNEFKGFKLVGITKDTIMFSGNNNIEVEW